MSESKFYHFAPGGLFYSVGSAEDALKSLEEGGFIWLDYYNPGKKELYSLAESMGIHPLSVEDCLDSSQLQKIEHFHDSSFIIFNAFTYKEKELHLDEIDFFIGRNFLITVSGVNADGRKPLKDVIRIIESEPAIAGKGPAFLMHVVLDYIVDSKLLEFELLEDEMEDAENKILDNPSTFQPADLMRIKKYLVTLRKGIFHEREILVKISRNECPFIPESAIVHYRDIYDHLTKFFELTETNRELVTSLMELYSSLLNNHMTKLSNATNASVKRLTMIATVFLPLTLIAGIGGMSEWTMMTGGAPNWKISYPLFIIGLFVIAIINYFVIRRLEKNDWLRRNRNKRDE